ncbi:TMS membrane protein/tumor differentially expressed protein, partial [Ancylostoma duodenale]
MGGTRVPGIAVLARMHQLKPDQCGCDVIAAGRPPAVAHSAPLSVQGGAMGALLAAPACAASMACCFGSAACSLCCAACPTTRNSTTTRIMYALMLFVGTFVACIMLAPGIQEKLAAVRSSDNWFCQGLSEYAGLNCERATGFQAVYRMCAAMASFFFIFMILMLGVKSSKDARASIQNGF